MFTGFLSLENSFFEGFRRLQDEIDEIFANGPLSGGIRSLPRGTFPAVNITSSPDKLDVYLFAPGLDKESLDISIQQNVLTISGKRQEPENDKATYYRRERFTGEFKRVISLPDDADSDRVEAKYRDGIIHVTVQRRESAKPRQIQVH